LLLIVETTPNRLWGAVSRSAVVTELVVNRWIRLASLDPVDGTTRMWEAGEWREVPPSAEPLPVATTSPEWFAGKIDHLPIARIGGRP